jgi:hypothetical protein
VRRRVRRGGGRQGRGAEAHRQETSETGEMFPGQSALIAGLRMRRWVSRVDDKETHLSMAEGRQISIERVIQAIVEGTPDEEPAERQRQRQTEERGQ